MKQYSILRDVLTTKVYGLAVKNANNFEFLGFNKQSCQWANLANQKQLDISQLPDGIIAEDFQEITEDIAKQFDIKIDPISNTSTPVRKKINNFYFEKSERFDNPSRTPSITDIPLGSFNEDVRQMVLEFKTKTFRQNTIRGEIALKSRFNQLAFDPNTSKFNPRPNSNFKKIHAEELQTKASNIVQRRFGKEIIQQINSDIETKWPGEFIAGFLLGKRKGSKKRKKTGMKTMEILDFHEKGIGRAIGRAATPNVGRSRKIGMRASREITGVLDPSRRRDVDGDGLIFDGTWREMPDPTRFKPNERVQKPFSPDPNKPIGSQSLQIIEENEKRRGDFARMLREVERDMSQTNFRDPYGQGRAREIAEREKLGRQLESLRREARKPRSERSARGVSSRSNYPLRSEPPLNPPESELSDEFIDDYLLDSVGMGELELEDFKKYNKQSKKPLSDSDLQDLFDRYKSEDNVVNSRAVKEVISQFYDELVDDNYKSMLGANEPYEPDTGGRGLSSRTAPREGRLGTVRRNAQRASENRRNRGTRPLPVAMTPNARRAIATTERASSPRGLQSRSGVQKQGKGIPGVDKIGPSDGAQWEALTPDQKVAATTVLDKELERVTGELKKRFAGYWRGQVRGAKKQGIRGGRYAPRNNEEAFTTSDITEMQRQLDSNTSATPEVRVAVQKQIDAVRLMTTMKSKKNYSMLEQLHPAQKAKVLDALKKTDNFKPLKGFTRTSESSAFKGGAGLSKEDLLTSLTPDISLDDKKKDKKNVSFRNRILRANPERQRRRELRRQRRTGAVGRTGISLDPELQLKKRKLRAAAFKRQILSKFRKSKDAEKLSDSLGERKAELHPVQIDADGNIKLASNFVETMDALDKRLLGGKKEGDTVYDSLLRDLWENFGYSEVPALVTEEEVKSLLAAGWQPIVRGTGNEEVMSESYVEQFLTSEGRFIVGQGGRAYGVGEYFAYPGGNWGGFSGAADSRHTMLVLIPPSATILTRRELSNEQAEMNRLTTSINNEFKIAGDRETVSALSAQELAQMIRKASPQLANSKTRSGQILNQLTLRLEELDNMPGDTSQERKSILNTFDLLERMSKKESGHFAPMIGVDAIDANDGDDSRDPILLHNRSIVAAFQAPMTRKQAEEMSSGVKKVWTKFKSRNKVVSAEQSPDSDSTATRRVKPRLVRRARSNTPQQQTQQSAQPQSQVKKSTSAVDTSSWKTGTPQNTGSNPATLLYAPDGTEYYTKLPKPGESVQQATERMETEVLASELYKLAGVPTVDLQMGDDNGTPQMLSKMVRSRGPNSQADQDSARQGFVVDAWLANWDAPLNDNIKFDGQNRPIRIDVGGSLDYRAQGSKKETTNTPFGDTVGEILSMQKRGTFNFSNMDPAEIKKQAQAMSSVTDASIRSTVSKIVSDPQRAAKLAQTLINRRNDIVTRYG